MPCNLLVYDTNSKEKTTYVCDEDTTTRVVEDDFAIKSSGEYTDVEGKSFGVDWENCRLIGFART